MDKSIIQMENLSVSRGDTEIFSSISLNIKVGQSTAILGPNGAGKSTLLKLLTREIYPKSDPGSSLKIFGESLWNIWELRSRIGIVSNDLQHMFTPDIIGYDIVLSGFFSSIGIWKDHKVSSAQKKIAKEIMESLGIASMSNRKFGSFSTGEQRRFILARALVSHPEALVLDEPTSGLDLRSAFTYVGLLRSLMRAGTTVILVTHNINEIPPEMHRVVMLKHGKIVDDGETQNVLTSKKLSQLFDFPMSVAKNNGFYQVAPAGK